MPNIFKAIMITVLGAYGSAAEPSDTPHYTGGLTKGLRPTPAPAGEPIFPLDKYNISCVAHAISTRQDAIEAIGTGGLGKNPSQSISDASKRIQKELGKLRTTSPAIKVELIHLAVQHPLEKMPPDYENIVVRSMHIMLRQILAHPDAAIVFENLSEDIDPIPLLPRSKRTLEAIFPGGLPETFKKITPEQKKILAYGAPQDFALLIAFLDPERPHKTFYKTYPNKAVEQAMQTLQAAGVPVISKREHFFHNGIMHAAEETGATRVIFPCGLFHTYGFKKDSMAVTRINCHPPLDSKSNLGIRIRSITAHCLLPNKTTVEISTDAETTDAESTEARPKLSPA